MKVFHLSSFDVSKVKEFFNPKMYQVQMFTSSKPVARLLMELGYPPKGMTTAIDLEKLAADDFYYFEIPEQFRVAQVQETKTITW